MPAAMVQLASCSNIFVLTSSSGGPPSHQRHANPTAPQFRERVIDLAGNGIVHIIADLRGAGFLDSAGGSGRCSG